MSNNQVKIKIIFVLPLQYNIDDIVAVVQSLNCV